MPKYVQFTKSRKFGFDDEDFSPESDEHKYTQSKEEKLRALEEKVAEGGDVLPDYDREGMPSKQFTGDDRPASPEYSKYVKVSKSDLKKVHNLVSPGDTTYKEINLSQLDEAIELRESIVGGGKSFREGFYEAGGVGMEEYKSGIRETYKGKKIPEGTSDFKGSSKGTRVDAGTAKAIQKELKILKEVKHSTIEEINKLSGISPTDKNVVIDLTTEREIRSFALRQGIIKDYNSEDLNKLSGVADYITIKKKEGKAMAEIIQDYKYDYSVYEQGSKDFPKGANPGRDLNIYRAIGHMHGTRLSIEERTSAERVHTNLGRTGGQADIQYGEPKELGKGYIYGAGAKDAQLLGRVFRPEVVTQISGDTEIEKIPYNLDDYTKQAKSLLGPGADEHIKLLEDMSHAEKRGYKFIVDESGLKRPDMSDVKWQTTFARFKDIEREAIARAKFENTFEGVKVGELKTETGSPIFQTYAERKKAGTHYGGENYKAANIELPKPKDFEINIKGAIAGMAGLSRIVSGGGSGLKK